jgi:hypothetical protein
MKYLSLVLFGIIMMGKAAFAQQPLNPKNMNYLVLPKVNNIVYHDSVFRGSKEFKHLFFRTGNDQLIRLYGKHQSNKIVGQGFSFVGVIAMVVGINNLSGNTKGFGWAMIGGGFLSSVAGGYFTLMGQKNLLMAIELFNQKHNKTALGIGIGKQSTGLVYNF